MKWLVMVSHIRYINWHVLRRCCLTCFFLLQVWSHSHIWRMRVSHSHVSYVTCATDVTFLLHVAMALLRSDVFSFFMFFFTFRKTVVCPPCSGLVWVLQSEEWPNRQLMLYAGVVEQSLLLKLLKLFRIEAEGVRPKVRPCVDERGAQRLSGERVHKWRLWQSWWSDHLLGFADLRVRFSKLQPDGLRKVRIEPNSLLQVLLGRVCACSRIERDKSNWARCLPILWGHL